jgi:protein-S-isoprenylcysteine O-methyltransferase Ste14
VLIGLTLWSIFVPQKRIWPPTLKQSWQYKVYWGLFYICVVLDVVLVFYEFDSWNINDNISFFIGIPLILFGLFVLIFSIYTLGIKNTYGLQGQFTIKGLYKYTRNPQYVGDFILLSGLILFINSLDLIILFVLEIITFILMPFAEEIWLEEQYGQEYLNYKYKTSRFL